MGTTSAVALAVTSVSTFGTVTMISFVYRDAVQAVTAVSDLAARVTAGATRLVDWVLGGGDFIKFYDPRFAGEYIFFNATDQELAVLENRTVVDALHGVQYAGIMPGILTGQSPEKTTVKEMNYDKWIQVTLDVADGNPPDIVRQGVVHYSWSPVLPVQDEHIQDSGGILYCLLGDRAASLKQMINEIHMKPVDHVIIVGALLGTRYFGTGGTAPGGAAGATGTGNTTGGSLLDSDACQLPPGYNDTECDNDFCTDRCQELKDLMRQEGCPATIICKKDGVDPRIAMVLDILADL